MKKNNKKRWFSIVSMFWIFSTIVINLFPIEVKAATMIPNIGMPSAPGLKMGSGMGGALGIANGLPNFMKLGDPSTATGEVEAGSIASTAKRKIQAPQASVSFSADGPIKEGNSVTATAITSGFSEQSDKLYYTWYLKHNDSAAHEDCDISDSIDQSNSECDMDGDEKITENDWKIEAARLNAARSYVSGDFKENSSGVEAGSGVFAYPSVASDDNGWVKGIRYDTDGELKDYNGDNGQVPNCYVQEPVSGSMYELRGGGTVSFASCPNGWHRACVRDVDKTCTVPNLAYNPPVEPIKNSYDANRDGIIDSGELATYNADYTQFLIDKDKYDSPQNVKYDVKVCDAFDAAVNNYCSNGTNNASAYSNSGTSSSVSQCDISKNETLVDNHKGPSSMDCKLKTGEDLANFSGQATCGGQGQYPVCLKDGVFTQYGDIIDDNGTHLNANEDSAKGLVEGTWDYPLYGNIWNDVCTEAGAAEILSKTQASNNGITVGPLNSISGNNNGVVEGQENGIWQNGFYRKVFNKTSTLSKYFDEECKVLVSDLINGVTTQFGGIQIYGNPNLLPTCTKTGGGHNTCQHLFPHYASSSSDILGDGKFTSREKFFWKLDPTKTSTSGIAVDEAAVIGLGMDNFVWNYHSGDQVGVAIEGDSSIPSPHIDSSMQRMWAFSKNTCPAISEKLGLIDSDGKVNDDAIKKLNYYTETVNGNSVGIYTADFDLNRCLEDNLIDPVKNTLSTMEINLVSSKEQPINDPTDGEGDNVNIKAAIKNSVDPQRLFFEWKLQKSLNGSDAPTSNTEWDNLGNLDSSQNGFGKNNFDFNLNFSNDVINSGMKKSVDKGYFYIRVISSVSEKEGDGSLNANESIILKVYNQINKINVFSASADQDGKLTLSSDQKCTDASDKVFCSLAKNEIMGLKVSNANNLSDFMWKVDGKDQICDSKMSTGCTLGGNQMFIAAQGEVGDKINVEVTAVKTDGGTSDHVIINRHFVIVPYGAAIISSNSDKVMPKIKGYFKNLDGTSTPDYSTTNFQTFEGGDNSIGLRAKFTPSWLKDSQINYQWTVDGTLFGQSNQKEISFPVEKVAGENYVIGLNASFKIADDSQFNNLRKALKNYWGISESVSAEDSSLTSIQVEIIKPDAEEVAMNSSFPWAANLLSHIPEQVLFSLRIFLSGFLLLFVTGLVFSLLPEMESRKY